MRKAHQRTVQAGVQPAARPSAGRLCWWHCCLWLHRATGVLLGPGLVPGLAPCQDWDSGCCQGCSGCRRWAARRCCPAWGCSWTPWIHRLLKRNEGQASCWPRSWRCCPSVLWHWLPAPACGTWHGGSGTRPASQQQEEKKQVKPRDDKKKVQEEKESPATPPPPEPSSDSHELQISAWPCFLRGLNLPGSSVGQIRHSRLFRGYCLTSSICTPLFQSKEGGGGWERNYYGKYNLLRTVPVLPASRLAKFTDVDQKRKKNNLLFLPQINLNLRVS